MPLETVKDGNGDPITFVKVPGFGDYKLPLFPNIEKNASLIRKAQVHSDDIWLITYPKCGTQWTATVIEMLISGKEEYDFSAFFGHFFDYGGPEAADQQPSPRFLVTHLSVDYMPEQFFQKKPAVIVMTRNPKDCVVSYYHHLFGRKYFTPSGEPVSYDGTFDGFFELFASGDIFYGSFFEYLTRFWTALADFPNVLFLSFEDAKEDLSSHIRKLAAFLHRLGYGDHLENEAYLDKVTDLSNFANMKKASEQNEAAAEEKKRWKDSHSHGFWRKGVAGDWRNHLNDEQSKRINQIFDEHFVGSDLAPLRGLCEKHMR